MDKCVHQKGPKGNKKKQTKNQTELNRTVRNKKDPKRIKRTKKN